MAKAADQVGSIEEQLEFYQRLLAPLPGERVLDAGCGRGRFLGLLEATDAEVHGIDAMVRALAAAKAVTAKARLCGGDLRWLPYRHRAFDALFSRDTLECVPDPGEALDEAARVLRQGGRVLICHWDWYSQAFGSADSTLEGRMVRAFADTQQGWMEHHDGAMGRKLEGLVRPHGAFAVAGTGVLRLEEREWAPGRFGFEQSRAMASLLAERGALDPREAAGWLRTLEEAQDGGVYAYSLDHYWVLAERV